MSTPIVFLIVCRYLLGCWLASSSTQPFPAGPLSSWCDHRRAILCFVQRHPRFWIWPHWHVGVFHAFDFDGIAGACFLARLGSFRLRALSSLSRLLGTVVLLSLLCGLRGSLLMTDSECPLFRSLVMDLESLPGVHFGLFLPWPVPVRICGQNHGCWWSGI